MAPIGVVYSAVSEIGDELLPITKALIFDVGTVNVKVLFTVFSVTQFEPDHKQLYHPVTVFILRPTQKSTRVLLVVILSKPSTVIVIVLSASHPILSNAHGAYDIYCPVAVILYPSKDIDPVPPARIVLPEKMRGDAIPKVALFEFALSV